jgi:hypothetical protein
MVTSVEGLPAIDSDAQRPGLIVTALLDTVKEQPVAGFQVAHPEGLPATVEGAP